MHRRDPTLSRPLPLCARRRRPPVLIALFVMVLLLPAAARAGAWVKEPGHAYLKLGTSLFTSDHVYDLSGVRKTSAPFELFAQTTYIYGEIGLIDHLMFVGYLPFAALANVHEGGLAFWTTGLGDASLAVQAELWRADWQVLSTRLEGKIPLYAGGPSLQGRQGAPVPGFPRSGRYFPALGDGQLDVTAWLSAGTSWADVALPGAQVGPPGFASAEVGYRWRSFGVSDAFVGQGSAGVFLFSRRLLMMLNASAVWSLPVANERAEWRGKGYVTGGAGCLWTLLPGLSLEAGIDALGLGVNTAGGFQWQGGVSYVF